MRNDIKWQKSEAFSLRIIELYKYLTAQQREYVLSKQILRSATSIGANIVESEFSESPNDFVHKLTISQKEAGETLYWLRLLGKSGYIDFEYYSSLESECEEILKILSSIIIKMKAKFNSSPTNP